jgi:hypothetical protein
MICHLAVAANNNKLKVKYKGFLMYQWDFVLAEMYDTRIKFTGDSFVAIKAQT